jgi:phage nucleotide-binding protein
MEIEMKTISQTEPMEIKNISMVIFGQAGTGKTSIAYSSKNPIMIDCDGGSVGTGFRNGETLTEIASYSEIVDYNNSNFDKYDTIIIDSLGKLCSLMIEGIARNFKTRNGTLTQEGWGEFARIFITFVNRMNMTGKDVIYVAHDKNDGTQEAPYIRPDMGGKTPYNYLIREVDMIGMVYVNDLNKNIIDFTPTSSHVGKDRSEIGKLEIPHLSDKPNFIGEIFDTIKDNIGKVSAQATIMKAEQEKELKAFTKKLEKCETLEEFNAYISKNAVHNRKMRDVAQSKGWEFDTETKLFQNIDTSEV